MFEDVSSLDYSSVSYLGFMIGRCITGWKGIISHFFRDAFAFLSKLAKKRILAIIQVRFDNQYDLKRNITEFGNKISKALSHKRGRSVVSKRAQIYARVEGKF